MKRYRRSTTPEPTVAKGLALSGRQLMGQTIMVQLTQSEKNRIAAAQVIVIDCVLSFVRRYRSTISVSIVQFIVSLNVG
jgi:hypothetical protein